MLKRLLTILGVVSAIALPAAQTPFTIEEVLFRANEYVVHYQRDFSAVVAEEQYHQEAVTGRKKETRDLASDVLLVRTPNGSWSGYRDTFEVDGKPVRDRQERVTKLFLESPATATKIANESARFNIGSVRRNFNVPMLPLMFLDPINQFRFQFQRTAEESIGGTPVWTIQFTEYERPTLIRRGREDVFARGTMWIDPTNGRVVKTNTIVGDSNSTVRADLTVTYRPDETLGVWVPAEMIEVYDNPRDPTDERVTCRATYARFRRFDVRVSERVK